TVRLPHVGDAAPLMVGLLAAGAMIASRPAPGTPADQLVPTFQAVDVMPVQVVCANAAGDSARRQRTAIWVLPMGVEAETESWGGTGDAAGTMCRCAHATR